MTSLPTCWYCPECRYVTDDDGCEGVLCPTCEAWTMERSQVIPPGTPPEAILNLVGDVHATLHDAGLQSGDPQEGDWGRIESHFIAERWGRFMTEPGVFVWEWRECQLLGYDMDRAIRWTADRTEKDAVRGLARRYRVVAQTPQGKQMYWPTTGLAPETLEP